MIHLSSVRLEVSYLNILFVWRMHCTDDVVSVTTSSRRLDKPGSSSQTELPLPKSIWLVRTDAHSCRRTRRAPCRFSLPAAGKRAVLRASGLGRIAGPAHGLRASVRFCGPGPRPPGSQEFGCLA